MQTAIPCLFMRGGTSRGPFFHAADLPADIPTRDKVLLAVMGSPDTRQIDGLGGAHPLTSKVGIVSQVARPASMSTTCSRSCQPDKAPSTPRPTAATCWPASGRSRSRPAWCRRRGDTTTRARADGQHRHAVRHHRADAGRPRRTMTATRGSTACPAPRRRSRIEFLDTAGSVCAGAAADGQCAST